MKKLIITEKSSQAETCEPPSEIGSVNPAAEGHLCELAEPEEVNAEWKCWSCTLLEPDGLIRRVPRRTETSPPKGDAAALKSCDQVILATDCDREGQGES